MSRDDTKFTRCINTRITLLIVTNVISKRDTRAPYGDMAIPYTKLTTKEIIKIQQNTSLEETLKSIDRNIYSTVTMSALQNDFEFLKDYSLDRYNHVTEVIRNNA